MGEFCCSVTCHTTRWLLSDFDKAAPSSTTSAGGSLSVSPEIKWYFKCKEQVSNWFYCGIKSASCLDEDSLSCSQQRWKLCISQVILNEFGWVVKTFNHVNI